MLLSLVPFLLSFLLLFLDRSFPLEDSRAYKCSVSEYDPCSVDCESLEETLLCTEHDCFTDLRVEVRKTKISII